MDSPLSDNTPRLLSRKRTSTLNRRRRGDGPVSPLIELRSNEGPLEDPCPYYRIDKPLPAAEPPTPPRADRATQIFRRDWLLFDFDVEVRPVVQVLAARVLDSAKAEIAAEEADKTRDAAKKRREFKRAAVLQRVQQAETAAKRWEEEKEKRGRQAKLIGDIRKAAHAKLFARTVAKTLLVPSPSAAVEALFAANLITSNETEGPSKAVVKATEGAIGLVETVPKRWKVVEELMSWARQKLLEAKAGAVAVHEEAIRAEQRRAEELKAMKEEAAAKRREIRRKRRLSEVKRAEADRVYRQHVEGGRAVKPGQIWAERLVTPGEWDGGVGQGIGLYLSPLHCLLAILSKESSVEERGVVARRALAAWPAGHGVEGLRAGDEYIKVLEEAGLIDIKVIDSVLDAMKEIEEKARKIEMAPSNILAPEGAEGAASKILGSGIPASNIGSIAEVPEINTKIPSIIPSTIISEPIPEIASEIPPNIVESPAEAAEAIESSWSMFLRETNILLRLNHPLNMEALASTPPALLTQLADLEYIYQFDGSLRALQRQVFGLGPNASTLQALTLGNGVFGFVEAAQKEIFAMISAFCFEAEDPRREESLVDFEQVEELIIQKLKQNHDELLVLDYYS